MDILEINRLTMAYDGKVVFKDLSLSLEEGKFLFILGENGSGKTTLVKAILGLLPLHSGTVRWKSIGKREVAYLSQTTEVRKEFPASVEEIVLSGCLSKKKIFCFYTKKDRLKALGNMKNLEVDHLRYNSFSSLSGGQGQRVLIARALTADAKVLILDEPSKGLDQKITAELYEFLEHLNLHHKITIIMVSHDIDAAKKYASDILSLSTGGYELSSKESFFKEGK